MAEAIAKAVHDFDPHWCSSGSRAAMKFGPQGRVALGKRSVRRSHLSGRRLAHLVAIALMEDVTSIAQVKRMVMDGIVRSVRAGRSGPCRYVMHSR
jgi:hypothetical protein